MAVAGRRRLVAQPGGLTLGFAVHLVAASEVKYFAMHCTHMHTYIHNKSYSALLCIKTEGLCSTKVHPHASNKLDKTHC